MALAREPGGMRDLGDGAVAVAQQLQRVLDPPFHDISVWRLANRDFKRLDKVVGAQSGNPGEFDEPELFCQLRVDIIQYAPSLPRRQPAPMSDQRTLRGAVAARRCTANIAASPSR